METEQTTIICSQWNSWASYDAIKHHMTTTGVIIKIALMARRKPLCQRFCEVAILGKYFASNSNEASKLFTVKLTSCNLKIGITSPVRVKSFFTFTGKFPKILFSGLVYKRKCGGCNATYYSKTKRHFKVRIWEHLGISYLNGKKVKIDNIELRTLLMLQLLSIL